MRFFLTMKLWGNAQFHLKYCLSCSCCFCNADQQLFTTACCLPPHLHAFIHVISLLFRSIVNFLFHVLFGLPCCLLPYPGFNSYDIFRGLGGLSHHLYCQLPPSLFPSVNTWILTDLELRDKWWQQRWHVRVCVEFAGFMSWCFSWTLEFQIQSLVKFSYCYCWYSVFCTGWNKETEIRQN